MKKSYLITAIIIIMLFNIKLQPKQMMAMRHLEYSDSQYLFYGGAKGGGKSYLVRASQIYRRLKSPGTIGVIIRKTFPELFSNHIRKMFLEFPITYKWYKAQEKAIYYPNGSITEFRHLDSTNDVYNYQGIEYDDICIDEATQHEEDVFKILKTSLRSDPLIRARNPEHKPKVLLTGNPGGIGHAWVKRIFVDADLLPNESKTDYDFIQAKIWDNKIFIKANPQYLKNLEDLPEHLRKAYLDGDWEIFAGQYFKKLRRDKHLIEPFTIPPDWLRFRSLDWGYDHNTVVLWWAVDFDRNAYIYRYYKKNETVASKMAREVVEMTPKTERIVTTVAGHDVWNKIRVDELQPYETMADIIQANGLYVERANIDRVPGWQVLRELLEWDEKKVTPRLRIFNTCEEVYKDIAGLIHDEKNPEDVLKIRNDDTGDAMRYGGQHIFAGAIPERQKDIIEQIIDNLPMGDDSKQLIWDRV